MEIFESKRLFIYSGGRNEPYKLTGYTAGIESVKLKHKPSIAGKEKSTTGYYFEVLLQDCFTFEEDLAFEIDIDELSGKFEEKNRNSFARYIPVTTTFNKLLKSKVKGK